MAKSTLLTNKSSGSLSVAGTLLPNDVKRVTEWVIGLSRFQPVNALEPYSVHLDELLERRVLPIEWVSLACRVMQEVVAQASVLKLTHDFMPSLRFVLNDAERLNTTPPARLIALSSALRVEEPPSLYLVRRDTFKHLRTYEGYVRPLPFSLFPNNVGIYCFYETFRTVQDMEKGWEYGRVVGADYYPEALR